MPVIADVRDVEQIDVVAVAPREGGGDWARWAVVPGKVIGTWTGARVREVLDLVAALPEDEQMRCFNPRYGIRVRSEAAVLSEVALCFSCHNALVIPSEHTPGLLTWFTFDPESPPAQELLRLFRACEA
ncbi:hypothetical protein GCM10010435_81900 [Winogradskya consettensis]|uniref:Uncharacterized protein n=1 Tax=Winogradskya consettensis TaxID=113560 RepID=A0A919SX84_9ACTN|nr:hypothetical protein [Actinoplanes consettensis]GIM79037.1 hypothetical protein Aco04nite_63480 [Actinoplanes consettensis]